MLKKQGARSSFLFLKLAIQFLGEPLNYQLLAILYPPGVNMIFSPLNFLLDTNDFLN